MLYKKILPLYKITANHHAGYLGDHFGITKTNPEKWINKLIPTKGQPYLSFDALESISLEDMVKYDLEFSTLDVKIKARNTINNKIKLYTIYILNK